MRPAVSLSPPSSVLPAGPVSREGSIGMPMRSAASAPPLGFQKRRKTMARPTEMTAAKISVRLYRPVPATIHLTAPKMKPTNRPKATKTREPNQMMSAEEIQTFAGICA